MSRCAFAQERTFERAHTLALSSLVGMGRKTVSGILCAGAQQFSDWSAAYRLFEWERFDTDALFAPARCEVLTRLEAEGPFVAMLDDTLVRKRGRRVHGAAWRKDPLGPPFHTNFVWGQRFVQVSAALPDKTTPGRARAIPIDLTPAPSAAKPSKRAPEEQWVEYRARQKAMKLSYLGAQRLASLRSWLDEQKNQTRRLIVAVDGSYTNRTVFRNLPHNTVVIGRIRKDAKLFLPPDQAFGPGRRRFYGKRLPTPEQLRQDESVPWIPVEAFAAGKTHTFEIKTIAPVRWQAAGASDLRLVVVRPLAYRPRIRSRLLYRNPSYLLCTDPELPLERLLQSYLWRWEVELNFRDEKTLLGVGQAQVRTPEAVKTVPAFIVAAYAFLLLAGTVDKRASSVLPLPKWRAHDPPARKTTAKLINELRSELWGKAMGVNLGHFVDTARPGTKPVLLQKSLPSAVCYAIK